MMAIAACSRIQVVECSACDDVAFVTGNVGQAATRHLMMHASRGDDAKTIEAKLVEWCGTHDKPLVCVTLMTDSRRAVYQAIVRRLAEHAGRALADGDELAVDKAVGVWLVRGARERFAEVVLFSAHLEAASKASDGLGWEETLREAMWRDVLDELDDS